MTARELAGSEWHGALSEGAASGEGRPLGAGPTRYRLGGELGVGAMGRVRVAYDTLLEREIALKQVRVTGDARAEAALQREARIAAGLDHPAIIAVLDAGEDVDGQPFYAMRVVHGRSVDEVIADGLDAAARTALVRAILQVAHAMAYAHARGVVHRDLSPRNVRIGAHGEVVVMDWGLAARVDEAAAQAVVCGTPGYRAPELARGEPASPASDVWSLGALLHRVVLGVAPGDATPRPRVRAELRSLLDRALAPVPAARYADAGAFAADLAAFLDGGAVAAHRDRPWHRVARAARRHPGALVAGAVGVALVAAVALVLGSVAVRRADDARRSRSEARAALRAMIVERAGDAVRADRRAEAEALADEARSLGDPATAAAVNAAFGAAARVIVRPIADEAACRTLDVRRGARLCVVDGRLWLDDDRSPRRALELDGGEPTAARFLADGGVIAASSSAVGNRVVRFDRGLVAIGRHGLSGGTPSLDEAAGWALVAAADRYLAVATDGSARAVRPCAAGATIRVIAADPSSSTAAALATVAWCSDGVLVIDRADGVLRQAAPTIGSRLPGATAAVIVDGRLVVGGSDGRVGVIALPSGDVVHVSAGPLGPIARVARGPGAEVIVVGADGVGLWRPDVGAWRHVAAATEARDAGFDGARVIAFGAGALAAWEHAPEPRTHRVTARAGLAAVAWSADSAQVAFGGGEGGVHVLHVATGQVRRTTLTDEVVKSLAFAPDGRTLAVGVATDRGLRALSLETFVEQPPTWFDRDLPVRRLGFVAPDAVIAFTYGIEPSTVELGAGLRRALPSTAAPVVDVSAPDRDLAVFALGARGAVTRYDRAGPHPRRAAPAAAAIAVSGDGRVLALVDADGAHVELRDVATDAPRGAFAAPGAAIEDLALDAAGARLAIARIDGQLEVWRVGDRRLILSLRAHTGRAAAVAFSPDDCALASAGWDAIGRVLALCPRSAR